MVRVFRPLYAKGETLGFTLSVTGAIGRLSRGVIRAGSCLKMTILVAVCRTDRRGQKTNTGVQTRPHAEWEKGDQDEQVGSYQKRGYILERNQEDLLMDSISHLI